MFTSVYIHTKNILNSTLQLFPTIQVPFLHSAIAELRFGTPCFLAKAGQHGSMGLGCSEQVPIWGVIQHFF